MIEGLKNAMRKQRVMKPRLTLHYYLLRLGCFVCTMFFTFRFRLWPVALMGWICLGMLFFLDFF